MRHSVILHHYQYRFYYHYVICTTDERLKQTERYYSLILRGNFKLTQM